MSKLRRLMASESDGWACPSLAAACACISCTMRPPSGLMCCSDSDHAPPVWLVGWKVCGPVRVK